MIGARADELSRLRIHYGADASARDHALSCMKAMKSMYSTYLSHSSLSSGVREPSFALAASSSRCAWNFGFGFGSSAKCFASLKARRRIPSCLRSKIHSGLANRSFVSDRRRHRLDPRRKLRGHGKASFPQPAGNARPEKRAPRGNILEPMRIAMSPSFDSIRSRWASSSGESLLLTRPDAPGVLGGVPSAHRVPTPACLGVAPITWLPSTW